MHRRTNRRSVPGGDDGRSVAGGLGEWGRRGVLDAVVVGALTAAASVLAVLTWQLFVHPDVLLGLWGGSGDSEWFEHHPGAVAALRLAAGTLVLLAGFLTGLALSFLAGT